jgi:hypothetical protein
MIATFLLLAVIAVFGQLELLYWRTKIANISTQPVSDRVRTAARISNQEVGVQDFRSILSLHEHAPGLHGPSGNFRVLNNYFKAMERLGRWMPSSAAWANAEMKICSKYAAVIVDQNLERNVARAAETNEITTRPSNAQRPAILSS